MASSVQSIAPAPRPEGPSRATPGRGTAAGDAFATRLDEAVTAAPERTRRTAPGPRQEQAPREATEGTTTDRRDAAPDGASDDAGGKAATAVGPQARQPAVSRPARAPQRKEAGDTTASAMDGTDRPADQTTAEAVAKAAASAAAAAGQAELADPEAPGDAAAGTGESGETADPQADASAIDKPEAASAAGAAVTALLVAAQQTDPVPAATAAATAAMALLQPALADPPPATPPANDDLRIEPTPAAATNPAAPHAPRIARPGVPPGQDEPPAAPDDTQAASPSATDGSRPEKAAGKDASAPGRDAPTLPDLRLNQGDGGRAKAVAVPATSSPPSAALQGVVPPETAPPADAAGTAGQEAAAGGKPHATATGEARTAAGEGVAAGKAQPAAAELQIATFSLDPATAGQASPAPGPHRDVVSGTPATAVPGQPVAQTPAVPVQAVPIEIGMRVLEGAQQFTVRLHPEDLGRVEVRIGVDDDGKVTAQLVVDKVETLAMLQRDSRTLERAFDQAGLKTSEGSLQFTLNTGSGQQQAWSGASDRHQQQTNVPAEATKIEPPEDLMAAIRRVQSGPGGLDIRI